ncbi:hypothetical protein [Bacillus sp. 7894-2]|uniref:hypothetical protein n=1 Tax=Bacillus sp. 7894-2 TaxID=2021695 RepID=UPI000BA57470|nr:hypothetical protein [Bacillus sp. 7894-2]PAE25592.1 hypothetical protein CHI10_06935 [Bacillus sp. 7894-2]
MCTFKCHFCNDEYSLNLDDYEYYSIEELIDMVLRVSAMELEKAWIQKNGLLYCGSCKHKSAKIYQFKLPTQHEPRLRQKEKPTDSQL